MAVPRLVCLLFASMALQSAANCCKACMKGKPCGNSCIAQGSVCHKLRGCASFAWMPCPGGQQCGNTCIPHWKRCSLPKFFSKICARGEDVLLEDAVDAEGVVLSDPGPSGLLSTAHCCKACHGTSKPCGHTCIARGATCHLLRGCASFAWRPCLGGQQCGNTCITRSRVCSLPRLFSGGCPLAEAMVADETAYPVQPGAEPKTWKMQVGVSALAGVASGACATLFLIILLSRLFAFRMATMTQPLLQA